MTTRPPRTFGVVQWLCGCFAFVVAVVAIPVGAIDGRDLRAAVALQKDGRWYDVVQVREHVARHTSRGSVSYLVDRVEVAYVGGVVDVRGFHDPPVPQDRVGWYVTYRTGDGVPAPRVRVGAHDAFLDEDYQDALDAPYRSVLTGFAVWVLVWTGLWVLTTVRRRQRQIARGHVELSPPRSLALKLLASATACYVVLFLLSFPLEHWAFPR